MKYNVKQLMVVIHESVWSPEYFSISNTADKSIQIISIALYTGLSKWYTRMGTSITASPTVAAVCK